MTINIYVGNLAHDMSSAELTEIFKKFGDVSRCVVVSDRYTGKSKGFGFVEMENDQKGQQAIDTLNGSRVRKRELIVKKARPRKTRQGYLGPSSQAEGRALRFPSPKNRNRG